MGSPARKERSKMKKEFQRSNSLPILSRSVFIENREADDIQIIISSEDHSTSLSRHEKTPIVPGQAVASQQDDNIRVIGMTTQEDSQSSLKKELQEYAFIGRWNQAKTIFDQFPHMACIPLTANGDTTLHIAVNSENIDFAKKLVNLKQMGPKDLEIKNKEGYTAFCNAATKGNSDLLQIMIEKNENLTLIPYYDGTLPVHFAALGCHYNSVEVLSSKKLLQKMTYKDVERLFFMAIIDNNMYGMAMKLFEEYPTNLAVAKNDKELTALHILARTNSWRIEREERQKMVLLIGKLWCEVRQLENKKMMDMISKPSAVLFDSVILGNFEILNEILSLNPELLLKKDANNGQTLLHVAVLYKNVFAFEIILKMQTMNLIIGEVDNDGNNIMHSAMLQEHASYFRLQIEKLVKERVNNSLYNRLMFMRNNDGKTPCDLLSFIERKKYEEAKEEAKGKANSGMVVATLISTIVFAASLTVPGDNKNNVWFVVFILTNAVALFTSSSAIIFFFSVFTYTINYHHESRRVVARRIYIGFILLFISIINMVIAFVAAGILIFAPHKKYKWVACAVAPLGLLPIFSFLELHFNISTLISLLTFLIFAVIIFKLYGLLALVYIYI